MVTLRLHVVLCSGHLGDGARCFEHFLHSLCNRLRSRDYRCCHDLILLIGEFFFGYVEPEFRLDLGQERALYPDP